MSKQSERLFEAISHLDDEMIDPALEPRKKRKKGRWVGWAALAASLCTCQNRSFCSNSCTVPAIEYHPFLWEKPLPLVYHYRPSLSSALLRLSRKKRIRPIARPITA